MEQNPVGHVPCRYFLQREKALFINLNIQVLVVLGVFFCLFGFGCLIFGWFLVLLVFFFLLLENNEGHKGE